MTGVRLFIDASIAMTRAVLMDGDIPMRLWFGPALGNEQADISPVPGDQFFARLMHVDRGMGMAFLDIGTFASNGHDGQVMMRLDSKQDLKSEGKLELVEITHMGRAGKRPIAKLISSKPLMANAAPGLVQRRDSTFLQLWRFIGHSQTSHIEDIVISTGVGKAEFEKVDLEQDIPITVDAKACGDAFANEHVLNAFHHTVYLPSGGVLIIDEAEAVTAIDIDSGAMGAPSRQRLNERLNREAATAILRELKLRNIGGQVIVDFLPMPKPVFSKFDQWIRSLLNELNGFGRAGWTPSGLFSFVLSRETPSLQDQHTCIRCENSFKTVEYTDRFVVRVVLCRLEEKLRQYPQSYYQVVLTEQQFRCYKASPYWEEKLIESYGARFKVILQTGTVFNLNLEIPPLTEILS